MSKLEQNSIAYKPFIYEWAEELRKKHEAIHWIEEELDLKEDVAQWKKGELTDNEKNHITQTLRLFTTSDVEVGKNYHEIFIPKFKNNEVRNMLASFACREAIHQAAYALINDTLGFPDEEFVHFLEYKEMMDKVEFMSDNSNNTPRSLALALAKSVFNEGVTLFASFAMLLHYKRFGKMRGMCTVVEWSIRDENMHVEGISKLFKTYCKDYPEIVNDDFKREIYDMARTCVSLEDKFIDLAFELEIEGLNPEDIKQYIRFITDRRLTQLGLKPNYNVDNPLDWLTLILNSKDFSNFFEKRVTEYEVNGLGDGSMW